MGEKNTQLVLAAASSGDLITLNILFYIGLYIFGEERGIITDYYH